MPQGQQCQGEQADSAREAHRRDSAAPSQELPGREGCGLASGSPWEVVEDRQEVQV